MKKYILLAIIILASFLRLYKLGSYPPSLNWDEASLGYNAYSILKTGYDEHGKFMPLTNFGAFGDYKPPLYIYATVPSIAIFGLNEFAIRLPSAFFGILTVILTYLIAKKLFGDLSLEIGNWKLEIAALAAFFLAISPWHLQFSRAAFEANLGLFFSLLGIYLFLKFATGKPWWILPSVLSFVAGMYTFTGQRLFAPFIVLIFAVQFRKQILSNIKIVFLSAFIAGIIFFPLYKFATSTLEGRLRFNEVTIFNDLEPVNVSTRYRFQDNFTWWSGIIHNRRFEYTHEYLIHYFDAFNPTFLFTKGDVNPRLSIQEVGELYYIDLPLILAGIYFLFSRKQKYRFLLIGWLLVSPLGPATARETPHALRMIHILPTYQLLSAFGLYYLYKVIKYKKAFITFAFLLLIFDFLYYLHMYYFHWPLNYSSDWQYGYKQSVSVAKDYYNQVDYIVVSKGLGRPYIYFLLYNKYDPKKYWNNSEVVRDKFYFYDVNGFDKYRFSDSPQEVPVYGKILYITAPKGLPPDAQKITEIKNLKGDTVFAIGTANKSNTAQLTK